MRIWQPLQDEVVSRESANSCSKVKGRSHGGPQSRDVAREVLLTVHEGSEDSSDTSKAAARGRTASARVERRGRATGYLHDSSRRNSALAVTEDVVRLVGKHGGDVGW